MSSQESLAVKESVLTNIATHAQAQTNTNTQFQMTTDQWQAVSTECVQSPRGRGRTTNTTNGRRKHTIKLLKPLPCVCV